jgi:ribosome maturation factor RimP
MALDIEQVRHIVNRVAGSSGLEVVDVEFRGGGKARMLRVFIDKPGGVTHEDCADLSREVGTILDVEDAVPGGSYTLEVSSPGLDRKLVKPEDYTRFAGQKVRVTTRNPVDGSRHFQGRLEGLAEGRVRLQLEGNRPHGKDRARKDPAAVPVESAAQIEIDLSNVEKANLVPEF